MSDTEVDGMERTGDECYWCGGDLAEGGSIRVQVNGGDPKRETCPDCLRDWPPEHPDIDATQTEESDR